MSEPYADTAATYLERGWAPIPLAAGTKHPPPPGWTGHGAPYPADADVEAWSSNGFGAGNVALRMAEDGLGIDVDNYADKHGGETLAEAEARLGPLPPTLITTSRDDGVSGIRLFKVPAGRCWASELGPGVEIISHHHRYAVVEPSVHPQGRVYGWRDGSWRPIAIPASDDQAALPPAWIAELDHGPLSEYAGKAAVTSAEVTAWLAGLPVGDPCPYVTRVIDEALTALDAGGSRHGAMNVSVLQLVRAGEQGHAGAGAALDTLEGAFGNLVGGDPTRPPDRAEWSRSITGAVAMVVASPTADAADRGCCGPNEGEDDAEIPTQLDDAHLSAWMAHRGLGGRWCWAGGTRLDGVGWPTVGAPP